ncbi:MAG: Gfo/Idh/MocA family oxidoreductase [Alphaproteobacteria bacterium]|nr:Gfo/Idh/MocA family oxidoreductase [Alphaproteobacteria bacterium]
MAQSYSAQEIRELRQTWPLPSAPRPIISIGCGGIVHDAHLPAYTKSGLPIAGLFDINQEKAKALARKFGVDRVYASLAEAAAEQGVVFDVALPPDAVLETVRALPEGAVVLIQKPLGQNLHEAERIVQICREKRLTAAVNFQLRFSPMMLAIRDAIDQGMIGEITDISLHFTARQPWQLWPFLAELEAVEVLMHSIHYLDWIRSVLGEPDGVYCHSVGHPNHPDLADARTSTILNYGHRIRCCLSLNHTWKHAGPYQEAGIRIDGQHGAAYVKLGLLLNYPEGEPDELHVKTEGTEWIAVPMSGRWFPDAFVGVMSNLQRFAAGEDQHLPTAVDDAARTMALVEACWRSSKLGGTPVPRSQ